MSTIVRGVVESVESWARADLASLRVLLCSGAGAGAVDTSFNVGYLWMLIVSIYLSRLTPSQGGEELELTLPLVSSRTASPPLPTSSL